MTNTVEQKDQATTETATHVPAIVQQDSNMLMDAFLNGSSSFFSTIVNDGNRETAVKIYNAISDAEQLSDHIMKPIPVTDFMAHPVELVDENTGEIVQALRVILVAEDGTSYACVSSGVQNSIERMQVIFGKAPWTPAIWLMAEQKKVRSSSTNKVLTVKALSEEEVKKFAK